MSCQTTFSLKAVSRTCTASIYGAEHGAICNPGDSSPSIDRDLDPGRHRHRPHAPVLADQIDDAPPAIALLNVLEGERRYLGAPQPAAEQHSQDRPVSQTLVGGGIRRIQ